jgi:hypothetical protein
VVRSVWLGFGSFPCGQGLVDVPGGCHGMIACWRSSHLFASYGCAECVRTSQFGCVLCCFGYVAVALGRHGMIVCWHFPILHNHQRVVLSFVLLAGFSFGIFRLVSL